MDSMNFSINSNCKLYFTLSCFSNIENIFPIFLSLFIFTYLFVLMWLYLLQNPNFLINKFFVYYTTFLVLNFTEFSCKLFNLNFWACKKLFFFSRIIIKFKTKYILIVIFRNFLRSKNCRYILVLKMDQAYAYIFSYGRNIKIM